MKFEIKSLYTNLLAIILTNLIGYLQFLIIRILFPNGPLLDQIFICTPVIFIDFLIITSAINKFEKKEKVQREEIHALKIISALLATLIFFTSGLLTLGNIDRSRSLYMFNWIGCAPNNHSKDQLYEDIEKKYGKEEAIAFEMRLEEQLNRKFVRINDGVIELTHTGQGVLRIAVTINSIFQLQGWKKHLMWKNCS
jgi:hypothetical protein